MSSVSVADVVKDELCVLPRAMSSVSVADVVKDVVCVSPRAMSSVSVALKANEASCVLLSVDGSVIESVNVLPVIAT